MEELTQQNSIINNPTIKTSDLYISYSQRPKFVLNVPMYTPADEGGESSDEEDDETFPKEYFNFNINDHFSYPFRTYKVNQVKNSKTATKKISYKEKVENISKEDCTIVLPSSNINQTQNFLTKLEKEAYDDGKSTDNLSIVIGLNGMKSLSTRKNNSIKKEYKSSDTIKTKVLHSEIAFYWNVTWYDIKGKEAKYLDVKKFYKQLKKKSSTNKDNKAEKFLSNNESEISPPYQIIREAIKNDQSTLDHIKKHKDKCLESAVYLSVVDSDTYNFNGIYSAYNRIVAQHLFIPPTVMSTGYEFPLEEGYPFHIASKIDRLIRVATASLIPTGTYYPEPNFCVLVKQGVNNILESFIDEELDNYKLESVALLRKIKKRGEVNFVFVDENPIITTLPERAKFYKGKAIKFSDEFINGGVPSDSDKKDLLKITQSTLNTINWAKDLYFLKAFKISGGIGAVGKFNGLMHKLRTENDVIYIDKIKNELHEIVSPKSYISKFLEVANKVKKVIDNFHIQLFDKAQQEKLILEENLEELGIDTSTLTNVTIEQKLTINELHNNYFSETSTLIDYNVPIKSIIEVLNLNKEKFELLISDDCLSLLQKDGIFTDVGFDELSEVYDRILQAGGKKEDFEMLFSNLDEGLFAGKYGDLDFEDIIDIFIDKVIFLNSPEFLDEKEFYDEQSAYELTVDHFCNIFENEYGNFDDDTNNQSYNDEETSSLSSSGSQSSYNDSDL